MGIYWTYSNLLQFIMYVLDNLNKQDRVSSWYKFLLRFSLKLLTTEVGLFKHETVES